MTEAPTRPVLRYHGGKWMLAPWIVGQFPGHRVYVEPFGGAASVLMRKPRSYAEVYNDLDGEVVNLFRVLQDAARAAELERRLRVTPFAREEFSLAYEPAPDPVERARRTLIRAGMGFGGNAVNPANRTGFRAQAQLTGSHPARQWVSIPDNLQAVVRRLQGVVIENRDALKLVAEQDAPDTLFFVDPPYPLETRGDGAEGNYLHEMTDDAHRALGAALRSLSGKVVLSGYACALYDKELFSDWRRVERKALADGARERVEVLWMNFSGAQRGLGL